MSVREFAWRGLVGGLVLGLVALGSNAVAQDEEYVGEAMCRVCHSVSTKDPDLNTYPDYMKHGHRWQEVSTGGQAPGADQFGFASLLGENGQPVGLPDPGTVTLKGTTTKMTWADVRAILGNFKEGAGEFVTSTGQLVSSGGTWDKAGSKYTKRCFHCHNPVGFSSTPTADDPRTMYGISAEAWVNTLKNSSGQVIATFSIGAPALDPNGKRIQGIQCEHCHGPAATMALPSKLICTNCHSSTDPTDPSVDVNAFPNVDANGKATWDSNKRLPCAPTADGKTVVITNHHGEGDEFRRSPHKAVTDKKGEQQGCVLCHDPHKSVWHAQGGVKYADDPNDEKSVGSMCTACHQKTHPEYPNAPKVRIRGAMGEIGLVCTDCHMPEKSEGSATAGVANGPTGGRRTHLFRINPTAMKATDNMSNELTTPWATTKANYWNSTDLNGDSFLTLDMVCTNCHDGSGAAKMTLEQMATAAKAIHRQPGLVDLTVNNGDGLQLVKKTDMVSVDFSLLADAKAGMKADWWVISQGPKGWSSWDGKKWKAGLRPWRKGVALADVPKQNVLNAKLSPGYYTYWVSIAPTDGSMNFDGVLVYVTP